MDPHASHHNMSHHHHHNMNMSMGMAMMPTTPAGSNSSGGDHHQHHAGMDMGDHSGMDHGSMHGSMDMKMYFHTGISEYILFEDCHTKSTGGLIGACAVIFVAAILYEGLKFLREVLLQRALKQESKLSYGDKSFQAEDGEHCSNVGSRMFSCAHFLQTFLHVVQVFISYCLMLIFMTYNVWLCLAVVLGAGAGYFLFGWKRAVIVDANEHCH